MLNSLGIHPFEILPVMTHQFVLKFRGDAEARDAMARLAGIRYQEKQLFDFAPSDPGIVYMGCQIYSVVPPHAAIKFKDDAQVSFFDLFYEISEVKSGCHHPDGVLWIKSGNQKIHREKLSILEILPMVLHHYGIDDLRQVAGAELSPPAGVADKVTT
jgi:hypothetical protein